MGDLELCPSLSMCSGVVEAVRKAGKVPFAAHIDFSMPPELASQESHERSRLTSDWRT